ncbi:MAG: site-specific integrase [Stellaceae bacterium]
MRVKLTARLAETLGPGLYWDTHKDAPRGFLLQVTKAGSRAYRLNYRRLADGVERRMTIGDVASRSIEDARKKAAEYRAIVEDRGDPLGDLEEMRAEPTVADLWGRFEAEELPSRAPRTRAEYAAMYRDWIEPVIGKTKVRAVEREHIERLHRKITEAGKARRANAVKSLCSTLYTRAIIWKMRDTNPAQHVKGNREDHHERFLSGEELDRLMMVLERRRDHRPDSVDAITLAALTGSRRGEILSMRWADVDLEGAVWVKPPELTKQRRPHRLTLSPQAVEVLRRRLAERDGKVVRLRDDDHVFRGAGTKTHCNALERDWREIRAEAGLTDVRFHDLRHSVASWLIAAGLSLPVVGSVLGHAKPATTARYAHLSDAAQRQAVDIVGRMVRRPGAKPA